MLGDIHVTIFMVFLKFAGHTGTRPLSNGIKQEHLQCYNYVTSILLLNVEMSAEITNINCMTSLI